MTALDMKWGATKAFDIPVTVDGVAWSLAGYTLRFLAKTSTAVADAAATITKNTGGGIVHEAEVGHATLTISPADTAALSPTETTVLLWECRMYPGAYPVDSGTLSVEPAVIRAAA